VASANGAVSGLAADGREEARAASHVGLVGTEQSVLGIVQAVRGGDDAEADVQTDTAQSTGELKPKSPGWTRR
jgi:hypothetical protein